MAATAMSSLLLPHSPKPISTLQACMADLGLAMYFSSSKLPVSNTGKSPRPACGYRVDPGYTQGSRVADTQTVLLVLHRVSNGLIRGRSIHF